MIFKLNSDEKQAFSLDNEKISYGSVGEGPLPCAWEVKDPERVMSEEKSQALVVKVSNKYDEDCQSILTLSAPGFDLSPNKDEQTIALRKKGKGSLSWIITPRKSGTFEIAISDILNTKIFGITVTNVFGLNAMQAKIASIFGGLFGPMLTVPWWWDRLRRKQKQEVQST
ncbi:hypothetical protein HY407_04515 [Candidatus Gottesmanbacteria bacterium]|nr:hypothetical protein [Candidatus Gottesmanbacteria bacterium]